MTSEVKVPDMTKLNELVTACSYDVTQLGFGNKTAATSMRKKLSQISKECLSLRAGALKYQKSLPTKTRKPKKEEPVVPEEEEEEPVEEPVKEVIKKTKRGRPSKK